VLLNEKIKLRLPVLALSCLLNSGVLVQWKSPIRISRNTAKEVEKIGPLG